MTKNTIQSIKGFKDILPDEVGYYDFIENIIGHVTEQYSVSQIRVPIIEKTELFNRSIGNDTDIVNKEMYDFIDKNGDSICLRPEGTVSIIRCALEHNLIYDRGVKKQKFWYYGPMFRHEKPQRGRFRQFNQFGIEYFGFKNTESDIEIIFLLNLIFERLAIDDGITLHINSLGTKEDRLNYKKIIKQHIDKNIGKLDDNQKKTLKNNPLRLLDSKSENMIDILDGIPPLYDILSTESKSRYDLLLKKLDSMKIQYIHDNTIVRGLDYYNDTVFEWRHELLGSQNAICAGGRYDNLVEELNQTSVPAIGFAMGIERIVEILKHVNQSLSEVYNIIPIINISSENNTYCALQSRELRETMPQKRFFNTDSTSSLSSQLKHAMKMNSNFIILITDENIKDGSFTVKIHANKMNDIIVTKDKLLEMLSELHDDDCSAQDKLDDDFETPGERDE